MRPARRARCACGSAGPDGPCRACRDRGRDRRGLRAPEVTLAALARLAPMARRMQPVRLPNGAWLLRDEHKSTARDDRCGPRRAGRGAGRQHRRAGRHLGAQGQPGCSIAASASVCPLAATAARAHRGRRGFPAGTRPARRGPALARPPIWSTPGRSIRKTRRAAARRPRAGRRRADQGPRHPASRAHRAAAAGARRRLRNSLCSAADIRCEECPMLERGWPDPETAAIVCKPATRGR